ncbi:response regulator [Nitratidesulfovibrio sp. HK-II]|uniref:response regulator n=1 Tax=Nitratidesulfovibrio sp. HK-II TaxID=2009266 RepID=UPI000EDA5E5A|nr:response regulator [Nitratidesulfovibrio sp. HK-II]GBO98068.1 response regulator receiver protein [Nitratidesulfovibrio sp. HK-II]
MRALIVEDDALSARVLNLALNRYFDTHCAGDAERALAAYMQALDLDTPFGVVLLDLMLPGESGLTVLERIRTVEAERGLPQVPVLVTTAVTDINIALRAFEQGHIAAYLVKPLEFERLYTELRTLGLLPPE